MGATIVIKHLVITVAVCCLMWAADCSVVRAQEVSTAKLIKEINEAITKARGLVSDAEEQRTLARKKARESKERKELIEKASALYGEAAETLSGARDKSEQLSRQKDPAWYREYFTLYAKLLGILADMGRSAQSELLIRSRGTPTDEQVQAWKDNIARANKESAEHRKRIAEIESEQGTVLINP
ncbi:MAG TPA: hypothetical protein VF251_09145 [Pyrinomonadaceae bacterium]